MDSGLRRNDFQAPLRTTVLDKCTHGSLQSNLIGTAVETWPLLLVISCIHSVSVFLTLARGWSIQSLPAVYNRL